ncbi:hypothetical protein CXB51_026395 [Gossypium anomalum]|uniref:STAS domain-containing protein n=1 Tax=Gossypium anomalum TaxID=47600 RepID=A0A8J5YE46_9ROSI|nr:hypothetical protein CXB51_026395 [Gossypium anomalum]
MASPLNNTTTSDQEMADLERHDCVERVQWVLNTPKPPGLSQELIGTAVSWRNKVPFLNMQSGLKHELFSMLKATFPILSWCQNYKPNQFKRDLLAGLTLASLCIPQSIGYATLAKLDPQYGLYTSVVPPLIYTLMGTSREIAIGPVAVISLLLSSMVQKLEDPMANPIAYHKLVLTVTFFAGTFQAAFGLFRSGFLIDFLSHAAIVGFMAGAAIVIGLQQLKGLLGITHFTNKTDVISVLKVVWSSFKHPWNPYNFLLGCSFLIFILITRFLKEQKTILVASHCSSGVCRFSHTHRFLTKADKHGVNIVKHIKGGLNPSSVDQLQFDGPHVGELAKIGLIVAIIALTEAIAVGRSFAAIKGYHLDGNKEMVAMGFMNIIGSFTTCYVATGSFSRTAVNFSAGCETAMSNIVMAVTVFISLELLTKLLYYTPVAILASIILSALPGLIDVNEACNIWKVDKLDFLACIGAFLGVLFATVEIGLLVAVTISFARIIVVSIRPGTETLGKLPETDAFGDVNQYPMAVKTPGVLIMRLKSALLCFANANFVRERIMKWVIEEEKDSKLRNAEKTIQIVILDISNLMDIDTSGIASLEELHKNFDSNGMTLAIANPRWQVIHKLKLANFVPKIGGRVFLSIGEAMASFSI